MEQCWVVVTIISTCKTSTSKTSTTKVAEEGCCCPSECDISAQLKRQLYICLQAAAEEKAAVSAKEGLEKRAREAESQAQQLADTVEELRLALDRQRASTELRYIFVRLPTQLLSRPIHSSSSRSHPLSPFLHKIYFCDSCRSQLLQGSCERLTAALHSWLSRQ